MSSPSTTSGATRASHGVASGRCSPTDPCSATSPTAPTSCATTSRQRNADAVADFTQGIARAIRWAQVTPRDQVIAKFKQIIAARGRNESAEKADYWKSTGVAGPGGVIAEKEIQLWIDWLVRNGELERDKLSAKDLYTNEYNPYANGTYPQNSRTRRKVTGSEMTDTTEASARQRHQAVPHPGTEGRLHRRRGHHRSTSPMASSSCWSDPADAASRRCSICSAA